MKNRKHFLKFFDTLAKKYKLLACLDLSVAFDLVNTELLVKRLGIMGMP